MTKKEYYETITPENSALVLVDHKLGLYTGVRDIPVDELKHNLIGLGLLEARCLRRPHRKRIAPECIRIGCVGGSSRENIFPFNARARSRQKPKSATIAKNRPMETTFRTFRHGDTVSGDAPAKTKSAFGRQRSENKSDQCHVSVSRTTRYISQRQTGGLGEGA